MLIRSVLAAAAVAVALGVGFVLFDSEPRQAGTNYVPELAQAVVLEGSDVHCQGDQLIPGDAAALRLLVGTFERPTPELALSVRAEGRTLTRGQLPAGRAEGHVTIPIKPVDERRQGAEVCIEVRGAAPTRRTVLYGTLGQVRFEWLRQGEETWLALVPTVAHRFGLAKPFVSGSWVLLLPVFLLALAWFVAIRVLVRELGR